MDVISAITDRSNMWRAYQPQAVHQARDYVESGKRWVVDIDLTKFFDRVNHDILMSRVARVIKDKSVLFDRLGLVSLMDSYHQLNYNL